MTRMDTKLNVLVLAASLRRESLNRRLAELSARIAERSGANVDRASLRDFDVPLYDGDLQEDVDWTSRLRPQPFDGRHGLLLSASPSLAGGNHGLWALRVPFEHLGARIFPDMFSLATAHTAFADGELGDPALRERFEKNVLAFLSLAEAARNYPCMKRAWVEFLGEAPSGSADRVDLALT